MVENRKTIFQSWTVQLMWAFEEFKNSWHLIACFCAALVGHREVPTFWWQSERGEESVQPKASRGIWRNLRSLHSERVAVCLGGFPAVADPRPTTWRMSGMLSCSVYLFSCLFLWFLSKPWKVNLFRKQYNYCSICRPRNSAENYQKHEEDTRLIPSCKLILEAASPRGEWMQDGWSVVHAKVIRLYHATRAYCSTRPKELLCRGMKSARKCKK